VGMSKQGEGVCIKSLSAVAGCVEKEAPALHVIVAHTTWRCCPGRVLGRRGRLPGGRVARGRPAGYHLPALSLAGSFEAGLPCGRVRFVRSAAAKAGEPAIAAAHLLAGARVALAHGGRYTWDAGARAPLAVHAGRMDASRPETTTQGCSASAPCAAVCMRACAGRVIAIDMHSLQRSGERW